MGGDHADLEQLRTWKRVWAALEWSVALHALILVLLDLMLE